MNRLYQYYSKVSRLEYYEARKYKKYMDKSRVRPVVFICDRFSSLFVPNL